MTRSVLIVGGGIAGMSFALRMRERGWAVDLIEIDPQWRVYGAGISITAPTFRAFGRLGLIHELLALGYSSQKNVRICTLTGQLVVEQHSVPIGPGLPTHGGIMRPILHGILSAHTRASGTDVRLGVTLRNCSQANAMVRVETSDGEAREYSLVVAADGVFSKVRNLIFPAAPQPRYTGQYCWRLVTDRPSEIEQCNFYVGESITAGLMPVSTKQMYMFLLQTAAEKMHLDEATQWQQLRNIMAPLGGPIGRLRDALSAQSSINVRPLEAILLPRPWHLGRVVLIGDAAHATTPHLASGAGIAVEDALVLSEELDRNPDVEHALVQFDQRRWERCRMVVENSVRIGQLQQTHGDPGALQALMAESERALREDI